MCDIAHAAPCPVSQCEDRLATEVSLFFNEGAQDEALIGRQNTGSKLLLDLDLDATGWVPPQDLFVFNQPLTKMIDDRLDA
jgi:hypothetical protein